MFFVVDLPLHKINKSWDLTGWQAILSRNPGILKIFKSIKTYIVITNTKLLIKFTGTIHEYLTYFLTIYVNKVLENCLRGWNLHDKQINHKES